MVPDTLRVTIYLIYYQINRQPWGGGEVADRRLGSHNILQPPQSATNVLKPYTNHSPLPHHHHPWSQDYR